MDRDVVRDKDFVMVWDNDDVAERTLGFWDEKNNTIFSYNGKRGNTLGFDNCKKIPREEEPEWAREAREKLVDWQGREPERQ